MTKFIARKNTGGVVPPIPPDPPTPSERMDVEGWARFYNFGAGVDGGGTATIVEFDDLDEIYADIAASGSTPKRYRYTGTDLTYSQALKKTFRINSRTNKSIIGIGQEIKGAEFRFDPSENIIFDNFRITESWEDLIRIRFTTGMIVRNMDLDGGSFWNGSSWVYPNVDGTIDITDESDLVTVMNTIIRNSDKTNLVSSSDTSISDRGKLRVTFNGVRFENNVQRTPLIRFGKYDMVNCFVTFPAENRPGTQKSIVPSTESQVIVRGTSFKDLRRVCEAPASPAIVGEVWFGTTNRTDISLSDTVTPASSRLWEYPTLGGSYYDVPLLTPSEAETYCTSDKVGTLPIV
jgi:pectate lyase